MTDLELIYPRYGISDPALLADWRRIAVLTMPCEAHPLFVNIDTVPAPLLTELLMQCRCEGSA